MKSLNIDVISIMARDAQEACDARKEVFDSFPDFVAQRSRESELARESVLELIVVSRKVLWALENGDCVPMTDFFNALYDIKEYT